MKAKRKYTRREKMIEPFVVYVTFPSSVKEYAYLCYIPGIRQGDMVIANGTQVRVHRTASSDPLACRFVTPVPDAGEVQRKERIKQIAARLAVLQRQNNDLEMWAKLANKNTEAKKLYTELKRLIGVSA